MSARRVPAWPLMVLALPAGVSIWAGWVGLGQMTGFGVVPLLPGIWDELRINTAITLPIGMECYAAYAMRAWLTRGTPPRARRFAKTSAIGALVLGTLGQIAYHLMAAAGVTVAPWVVTMLVSCLPVAVFGMGAALYHLLTDEPEPEQVARPIAAPVAPRPGGFGGYPGAGPIRPAGQPDTGPPARPVFTPAVGSARVDPVAPGDPLPDSPTSPAPGPVADRIQPAPAPVARPAAPGVGADQVGKPRTDAQLSQAVEDLTRRNGGTPPSQYQVRQALGVGSGRAARLLAELATTTPAGQPVANGAAGKEGTR